MRNHHMTRSWICCCGAHAGDTSWKKVCAAVWEHLSQSEVMCPAVTLPLLNITGFGSSSSKLCANHNQPVWAFMTLLCRLRQLFTEERSKHFLRFKYASNQKFRTCHAFCGDFKAFRAAAKRASCRFEVARASLKQTDTEAFTYTPQWQTHTTL